MQKKIISVIVPLYNEQDNVKDLYERFSRIAEQLSRMTFEFIFVDDASTDDTGNRLRNLTHYDDRVKIIQFSRNFGTHAACLAGLVYSRGDVCTFMYADLQDPPELIMEMLLRWEDGIEVVIGIRERQNQSKRLFPRIYYSLVRKFALENMPVDGTDIFLIDRKVVDVIVDMKEKNTSIFGLILWSGFSQSVVQYTKGQRVKGASKWTVGKKAKLFVDTFVAFSYAPIRMISVVGILFAFSGFAYASFIILSRLFWAVPVEGWASLMVVLLVVSGVQMVMLGVLGEYLWRNFDESRRRPPYIIRNLMGIEKNK